MKTAFEERGPEELPQPQPGEIIGAFEASHNAVVQSALRLHSLPSATSWEDFKRQVALAGQSITPFSVHGFFKESETPIPLQESVDKIAAAIEELLATTLVINPLWTTGGKYAEMDREEIIETLTGEDDDAAKKKAQELCKDYNVLLVNMEQGVLQSPNVARFLEKQAYKAELKERTIAFGLVAAGTFLGHLLAEKRKK